MTGTDLVKMKLVAANRKNEAQRRESERGSSKEVDQRKYEGIRQEKGG